MGKTQEFSIKAPSEDPKKNEKPGEEPDKAEGSSKLLGTKKIEDGKEGEGEELVCFPVAHGISALLGARCLLEGASQKKISS